MYRRIARIALAVVVAFLAQCVQAQEVEAPNYQQIKQQINNSKSNQFYPRLFDRMVHNDTTLTIEDYRMLYYGYVTREDYVPYQEKEEKLLDIRRRFIKNDHDPLLLEEVIKTTAEILDNDPFNMSAISLHAMARLQKGDSIGFQQSKARFDGIMEAILSSGDGESASSSFHIIDIAHEYEITSHLGLSVVKDSLISNRIEFLRVEQPNADNIPGIYFNFDACSNAYRKKYE